jgi:hypothetical protein
MECYVAGKFPGSALRGEKKLDVGPGGLNPFNPQANVALVHFPNLVSGPY